MKERPILMNGAMVRATLAGSKTQTRRVVKMPPSWDCMVYADWGSGMWPYRSDDGESPNYDNDEIPLACPYGMPGDRLWVRETFGEFIDHETINGQSMELGRDLVYRADNGARVSTKWTPSIFMPRAASRILLEIVSVRVQRLNDCSEADAKAEGVLQLDADHSPRPDARTKDGWSLCSTCAGTGLRSTLGAGGGVNFDVDCTNCDTHLKLYRHLWEAINGAGSWDANPWVWCVEFERVTP